MGKTLDPNRGKRQVLTSFLKDLPFSIVNRVLVEINIHSKVIWETDEDLRYILHGRIQTKEVSALRDNSKALTDQRVIILTESSLSGRA